MQTVIHYYFFQIQLTKKVSSTEIRVGSPVKNKIQIKKTYAKHKYKLAVHFFHHDASTHKIKHNNKTKIAITITTKNYGSTTRS